MEVFFVLWKIMFKVKLFLKMKRIISNFCIYLIKSKKISFCKTSLSLSSSVRRLLLHCCKYKIKSFINKLKVVFYIQIVWAGLESLKLICIKKFTEVAGNYLGGVLNAHSDIEIGLHLCKFDWMISGPIFLLACRREINN